ncbi:unnamed protein product [Lathyrus oleraceus]
MKNKFNRSKVVKIRRICILFTRH